MSASALYFTGPRETSIRTEQVSGPEADEVLVESRVSAVSSGTELLVYRGEAPEKLDADATIDALGDDLSYPLKYGYATVGDVTQVGADVPEEWHGRTVFAFNPHQTRFTATPDRLFPVPDDVGADTAALLPTAETATNLVLDGDPGVGERVVVFGAGVVGLFTTAILAEFPLSSLTVVEPIARRRKLAERLGADRTHHPEAVADLHADRDPAGADLAFEVSGSPEALDDAIDAVGYDGSVVVGSWYGQKRADLDLGTFFHRNRVDIVSSQVSSIDPERRGRWDKSRRMDVAWERLRGVDTDALVTHRVPFDDAADAYRLLDDDPAEAIQVLLTFD